MMALTRNPLHSARVRMLAKTHGRKLRMTRAELSGPVLHLPCLGHPELKRGRRGTFPTECGRWVKEERLAGSGWSNICPDCLEVIS